MFVLERERANIKNSNFIFSDSSADQGAVFPQTFLHTVLCVRSETASNTISRANAVVRQNLWIFGDWDCWFAHLSRLSETYIFFIDRLTIHPSFTWAVFRTRSRTRKLRLMSTLSTRILIFVRGTSSLAQAHTSRGAARVPSSLRWSVNLTTGIPYEDNKIIKQ